jgi:DNA-binding transcriptional LysR family regulator
MNFTIKQIKAFVAVAELESFNAAANRLNLSSSAVSLLVRELELQLGFTLFDRTTRKVSLSKAGRDLMPSVLKMLREVQAVNLAANDVKNRTTGVVRVAAPLIVASAILPPMIAAYRSAHPGVMIRPVDCTVEDLVRMVEEDRADMAVGPDRPTGDAVKALALYESPWVLWCAPEHELASRRKLTWASLKGQSIVAAGRDYENRVAEALRDTPESQRFDPTYVVDNISTALGLAASGLGVTLSPAYVGVLAKKLGLVMRRVTEPEVMREVSVFTSKVRTLTPAAAAFLEFLVPRMRAMSASTSRRAAHSRAKRS